MPRRFALTGTERNQWRLRRLRNDRPWRIRISFGSAPTYRISSAGGILDFERQSIMADPVRVALAPDPGQAGQLHAPSVEGMFGIAPTTAERYAVPSKSGNPVAAQGFRASGFPGKAPRIAHPRVPAHARRASASILETRGGSRLHHALRCAWAGQTSGRRDAANARSGRTS